jgi:hypothetical protein
MNLKTIMSWSDGYTDEVQTEALAIGFANKAIATINTAFNLRLPFITDVNEEYDAMDVNWFVRFVMAALSYGIKMNDGSLTEAYEYKNDFEMSMYEFEGVDKSKVISEEYLGDGSMEIHHIDTSYAIDIGWFGQSSSSWNGW